MHKKAGRFCFLHSCYSLILAVLLLFTGCSGHEQAANAEPSPAQKEQTVNESNTNIVYAKTKPSGSWTPYTTRTLGQVAGYKPGTGNQKYSRYGGRLDKKKFICQFFHH